MFLSPATPALPSILAARAAVTFFAISFLLDWDTLASPSGAGTGVRLSADRCGWGWLAPTPLWERLENSSILGDPALLALLQAEPHLTCLGRMLPWKARGQSPKKMITSPPHHRRCAILCAGERSGSRTASSPQDGGSGFAKCRAELGITAVVLLSLPLCPASLPWEPWPQCWTAVSRHPGARGQCWGT